MLKNGGRYVRQANGMLKRVGPATRSSMIPALEQKPAEDRSMIPALEQKPAEDRRAVAITEAQAAAEVLLDRLKTLTTALRADEDDDADVIEDHIAEIGAMGLLGALAHLKGNKA